MNIGTERLHTPDPEELDMLRVREENALLEAQLVNPDGFLRELATAKVDGELGGDAREVASVIVDDPDATEKRSVRSDLTEKTQADSASKRVIEANSERILGMAHELGMRKLVGKERQLEDIEAIDPQRAVFVVESGANKSSIIRRGVAIKGMREVYRQGDELLETVDLSRRTLYQFGGPREIKPTKEKKGSDGVKTVPNPEYETIRGVAGDYLPPEGSFTEFEANLATALADGYVVRSADSAEGNDTIVSHVELVNVTDPLLPKLVLIQPGNKGKFKDGLTALNSILPLVGRQLVMATNGQYREKDRYTAAVWAKDNNIDMMPSVALGDEPGDTFPFKGGTETTQPRAEAAYVNEFVILWYLAQRRLRDAAPATEQEGSQGRAEQLRGSFHGFVDRVFDALAVLEKADPGKAQEQPARQAGERLGEFFAALLLGNKPKPDSQDSGPKS